MSESIYRILDANANRAREALRVIEDYTRFALDDASLSVELKRFRHELRVVLEPHLPDALLHRNTPGDVGTGISTPSEQHRADLGQVVVAAGKRLGESLRSLEECLKTIDPAAAAAVEALRYRAYELERRVGLTLRPAGRIADVRLYVLITESACRRPWLETAEQAILGGAACLQLREKNQDSGPLLARARRLVELCRRHGVLCLINDRPDIAVLADADGVHVGQDDLPALEARRIVGDRRIVGVSTHCIQQARQAVSDGADYIGIGPVFPSATKPRDILPGLDYVREVVAAGLPIPAVAIAGISADNVALVAGAGVRCVAVTTSVTSVDDPCEAARRLRRELESPPQVGSEARPVKG